MERRGAGEKHETGAKRRGIGKERKGNEMNRYRRNLHCCTTRTSIEHPSTSTEVRVRVCLSLEPGKHGNLRRRNLGLITSSEGNTARGFLQAHRKDGRLLLKYDGTRWRTGGEVKGKLANGVGSQYSSHYLGTWCIQHYYRWCAHLGWTDAPRTDLNGFVRFAERRNLGFCACAITFQTQSTTAY